MNLWIGGDTEISSLPKAGDAVLRGSTDSDMSIAWPSDRLAMGSVNPYYICVISRRRSTASISDRHFALKFAQMPERFNDLDYLNLNFALIAHINGEVLTRPFTIDVTDDGSYHKVSFVSSASKSITLSLPTENLGSSPSGLYFTINNAPDSAELYIAVNQISLSQDAAETTETEFNAETWLGHYIKGVKTDMDAESDKISSLVNWPQQEPIIKDNGNIEISPIGFPEANLSGVNNLPDCTVPAEEGSENPPFVSNGYGVAHGDVETADTVFLQKVTIKDGLFYLPVEHIERSGGNFAVTLLGDFSHTNFVKMKFAAAEGANITGTELDARDYTQADFISCDYDAVSDSTTVVIAPPVNCTVDRVNRDMVALEIQVLPDNATPSDEAIISLSAQGSDSENGTFALIPTDAGYQFLKLSGMAQTIDGHGDPTPALVPVPDIYDSPESQQPDFDQVYPYATNKPADNVWACNGVKNVPHFRKGYSDGEVYGFVRESSEGIYKNGVNGNRGAGDFVNWFLFPGSTPFTNAKGAIVNISNFGLGAYYSGDSGTPVTAGLDDGVPEFMKETLHPVIHWGYGSNSDAVIETTQEPALPLDWPFKNPEVAHTTDNNSITLLMQPATQNGSVIGGLDYTTTEGEGDEEETTHYQATRHVVVIYNDLGKTPGQQPGELFTKTVKPTFIHLPAPLETEDGATCEIEVALQNINYDQAFNSGSVRDLSGYYALISQPRVYVCGGYQEFSTTRYPLGDLHIGTDTFTVKTTEPILDQGGFPIVHDPDHPADKEDADVSSVSVPVKVHLTNSGSDDGEAWVTGVARAPEGIDGPTEITFNAEFPWPARQTDIADIAVCGVVFVRDNKEHDPLNDTDVTTGLRTRTTDLIGTENGSGTGISEFHKFFSLAGDEDTGRTPFPAGDKRYLLATVFQGSTSTFQWKIGDRKKLAGLADSMTMWADEGPGSITDRAWKANYELIHHLPDQTGDFDDFSKITKKDGNLNFNVDDIPVSYAEMLKDADPLRGESAIARRLRVKMPQNHFSSIPDESANPVRQALKAYKQLIADYASLRMRLTVGDTDVMSSDGMQIDIGMEPQSEFPVQDGFFTRESKVINDGTSDITGVGDETWLYKLRTMPRLITNAYFDPDHCSASPGWEGFRTQFRDYLESLPYYTGKKSSVYSVPFETESPECDDIGFPGTQVEPSNRSVVQVIANSISDAIKKKQPAIAIMLDDFRRLADLQTVDYYNDDNPAMTYRDFETFVRGNPDLSPFAHIFSLDSTPYPTVSAATADDLDPRQREFLSADIMRQYAWAGAFEPNDPTPGFISEFHPETDEATAKIVKVFKSYLPFPKSNFGRRFYSSSRVAMVNGRIEDDCLYRKYQLEAESACCSDEDRLNRFINDSFINGESGSETDYNPDWFKIDKDHDPIVNLSAAPYIADSTFYDGSDANPLLLDEATYTRVYMNFTFSAKLGRWLATGYRQYPSAYLTPLYGNRALSEKLATPTGPHEIWARSSCDELSNSYKGLYFVPLGMISPMDIHVACVPALYTENAAFLDRGTTHPDLANDADLEPRDTSSPKYSLMNRLRKPYLPVWFGGLGLSMPCNVHGDMSGSYFEQSESLEHANFWSVRKYIRPATGAPKETDVPGLEGYNDGTIGSPGLYNMFNWPARHMVNYSTPSRHNPTEDLSSPTILWAAPGGTNLGRITVHQRNDETEYPLGHKTPSDFD